MAILRFLCDRPRPCRLRTASFWPRWQALSCVLTVYQVLWGPVSWVAFVTTCQTTPPCFMWYSYFWRENEAEGQDFIPGVGARFWLSRDLKTIVICESIWESSVCRVGQDLSPVGCISIRVIVTLSVMSDSLSLQSSRSMLGVLLMDSRSWIWIWLWLFYCYDYCIYLRLTLTWVNILLVYACSSL
jgi:hypothetical protein